MPFKHSRVLGIGSALSLAVFAPLAAFLAPAAFVTLAVFAAPTAFAAPTGVTPDTRVLDAVASGDQAAVRSLLKQHADVNGAQADGTTALHLAARQGDVETAQLLLHAGADVKAANRYGVTPLTEAAANSPGPMAALLLKAGADPNAVIGTGETALMTAAHAGNLEAAKALVAAGADVNAHENYRGQTALMWAAGEGHAEMVKFLAEKGADLNAHSSRREDPLNVAEHIPISHGGLTALLLAARQGEMECVRVLLAAGNDINQADEDGNNALILAIINAHYDLAGFLLDKGENPSQADKNGRTPLYAAVDMHSQDISVRPARKETDTLTSWDIIQQALAHGANPNAQLKAHVGAKAYLDQGDTILAAGATSFMRAARGADLPVMRLLVEKGADPKLAMNDKTNALMIAAGIGYREGRTRGTEAEAIEAIKFCMDQGLDLNAVSDKGETAMHGAAQRGADDIVQFLFAKGAKLDVKDKQGLTPLDRALGKGGVAGGGTRNPHASTVALIEKLTTTATK